MKSIKPLLLPVVLLIVFSVGFSPTPKRAAVSLTRPVNFYLYDTLLYVSDSISGINVYSVTNASAPVFKLNIPVRGNSGLAVRDSFIFANSYSSLLVLKVFQDTLYRVVKNILNPYYYYTGAIDGPTVHHPSWSCGCYSQSGSEVQPMSADYTSSPGSGGTGGSYAIFAVIDSFLYYLDGSMLVSLDIRDPANPVELSRVYASWAETIFPTQKHLFLGASTGMYIFNRDDPGSPIQESYFQHFRACDPVVVEDTLAFVTLRGGNQCGETSNELLVLSVKDPRNPRMISRQAAVTPYGLAVSDTLLYVSNGYSGYSLYDVNRPDSVSKTASWSDFNTRDFIWAGNLLYVMGFTGVRIMDAAIPDSPQPLSVLP